MPKITLDSREREIRWGARAKARNASLARPVNFSELSVGKRRLYARCAIIWAALVDRDHGFAEPEDIAEYIETDEQQIAAMKAIYAMLEDAFPEKKTSADGPPSENGRSPSSNSA